MFQCFLSLLISLSCIAVIIERFNRSLRELMMKEFVKNNNTAWYNISPDLINTYNNRYHQTIKMKPKNVNKLNEKHIKILYIIMI